MASKEQLKILAFPEIIPFPKNPCTDLPSLSEGSLKIHDIADTEETIRNAEDHLLNRLDEIGLAKDSKILTALDIAIDAHKDKFRKVSGKPYVLHPFDVSYILSCVPVVGLDPDIQAAALTHDAVEDSAVNESGDKIFTNSVIRHELGEKVAFYNDLLTSEEPAVEVPTPRTLDYYWYWRAKKQTALNKVLENKNASIIKTADFISNTHDFICDRDILDKNGIPLGNGVFENFKVDQPAILGRITHSTRRLTKGYLNKHKEINPLSMLLFETSTSLIKISLREELLDKKNPWLLEPLYREWINDLESAKEEILLHKQVNY